MGNSVVDLGAAAVDYVSDVASDIGEGIESFYDYLTETPKASAGGYYKRLGPGARQYFSGPGEDDSPSILDRIGFANGGDVQLQDDGSLPGVDDLRFMTPEEVETGSYNYLQDLEDRLRYHVSEAQNPVEMQGDVFPTQRSVDSVRYHQEEAEKLRDQIDRFRDRRARAVLNYPESKTKLYMKEGQEPYVKGFPDSIVEGYAGGGNVPEGIMSVDLGMEADKAGPDTMQPIPQYPGIEGFDIYTELAPEQFPRRPIAKQNFGKKRGFQFGQMVQRDEAVSGKLLKQAGIMTPVEVVKQNVDPKVMEQISRIMGRDIV
tara:strand:+ start:998 stop:1948 length:951 start_codon:yes stop_codon:yes gene_type:complete